MTVYDRWTAHGVNWLRAGTFAVVPREVVKRVRLDARRLGISTVVSLDTVKKQRRIERVG